MPKTAVEHPRISVRLAHLLGLLLALLVVEAAPQITPWSGTGPVEARGIAEASPDTREAARRLRRGGVPAQAAVSALRGVFGGADRDHYRALLDAQYTRPELAEAYKRVDLLDAATFDRRLADFGETPDIRAQLLTRLYGFADFDALLRQLQQTRALTLDNFAAAMAALAPPPERIAILAHRYHRERQFPAGGTGYYPDPLDAHALIRASHPGARHAAILGWLLAAGYAPEQVFERVAIGETALGGQPLDAIAGCVARAFPGQPRGQNPVITVRATDSAAAPPQADCYQGLARQLRAENVPRTQAAALLLAALRCESQGNPQCERQREAQVRAWLNAAGYAPQPSGGAGFVSAITVPVPPPQTVGKASGFRPDSGRAAA